jgi:hypothetical protein
LTVKLKLIVFTQQPTTTGEKMPKRVATYGQGRLGLRDALVNREPFVTSGALSATVEEHGSGWNSGRLTGDDLDRWKSDSKTGSLYVVWSYATPIAWVRSDGEVYRVSQRFSPTTSKHQGMLYML